MARIGAQTTTGGVVVVANSSTIGSSSALPDAAWIAARIHHDPRDTAYRPLRLGFPAHLAYHDIGYGGVWNATARRLLPGLVPVREAAARPSVATDEERDEKCQQL